MMVVSITYHICDTCDTIRLFFTPSPTVCRNANAELRVGAEGAEHICEPEGGVAQL